MSPLRPLRAPRAAPGALWLLLSVGVHGGLALVAVGRRPGDRTPEDPTRNLPTAATGETFEVPADDPGVEPGGARPPEAPAGLAVAGDDGASNARSSSSNNAEERARARTRPTSAATGRTMSRDPGDGDLPGTFGAAGDRSAVDLAGAFTRGFPQAASADPRWSTAPYGSAGTVDVTITIDDAGAFVDARSTGAPSEALAAGVRRTLALIRARAFVASGKETRLRVTATVTKDEVHDGLHGEVFAIGGSFAQGEGSGFFALAVGRRVDVRVQVLR